METSKLRALQREILAARAKTAFSSQAALRSRAFTWHLKQMTEDLFTLTDVLDDGVALIRQIARQLGATLELIQTSPDFRHLLMRRGEDSL